MQIQLDSLLDYLNMYKEKGWGKAWVVIENYKSFNEESEYYRSYHGVQVTGSMDKDEIIITMSE